MPFHATACLYLHRRISTSCVLQSKACALYAALDRPACSMQAAIRELDTWLGHDTRLVIAERTMGQCSLHFCAGLQAVENTGSKDWPAGTYDVVISNPNMIDTKGTWGWASSHAADGTVAGTITLVRHSACSDFGHCGC